MKAQLRKIARSAAGLPLIGRLVRIGVAVIRLPETRDAHRQFESEVLQRLLRSNGETIGATFQNEQLPSLLQSLSDLNQRQIAADHDQQNLVKSIPFALRKLTRDVVEVREQLASLDPALEVRLEQVMTEVERKLATLGAEMHVAQAARADEIRALSEATAADIRQRALESAADADRRAEEAAAEAHRRAQDIEQVAAVQRQRLDELFASMSYLLGRVEFVRRELMFEMRYGGTAPDGDKEALQAETRVIDQARLDAARVTGLRLNLGCGHIPLEGYLNVDRRALPGVDIVAEVDCLPFQKGEVSELCSAHLLEHFPEEQIRREMLPYWISLLKPDGVFRAIVPDGKAMALAYTNAEYSFETLRQVTFGGQDYDGDFHFNMFSPESLTAILKEAGMSRVELVAENRENGGCKEFEIVARR